MISFAEAAHLIKSHLPTVKSVKISIEKAVGWLSACDVHAPFSLPPFVQSSVDGYAIRFHDLDVFDALILADEVAAGGSKAFFLKPGSAVRIFTGAPVPLGADTVVMQEFAKLHPKGVSFDPRPEKKGMHVREVGAHLKKGDLVLLKGQRITAALVGHLSGLGINDLEVIQKPSVAIVTTGSELMEPGTPLSDGKIYDSNKAILTAALEEHGVSPASVTHVSDNPDQILSEIEKGLELCDLLILTGGVSVGSYDYVVPMLEKAGVTKIFQGVKQKPGKPLYFGKKGTKLIFGLPGNPVSTLVCFDLYISSLMQSKSPLFLQLPLASDFHKKAGLTHFLRGFVNGHRVEILAGQESYMLHTFTKANCLVLIPEALESVKKGELVDVRIF
jgi:molybdopterin molybdotransferase